MALIPLEEALATVLAGCSPLPARPVALAEVALHQVLAEDVLATLAVPPFANTAMDGYAVRASDVAATPVRLPVVAEIGAGHPTRRVLRPGEAMRIFTGAAIPDGADAVVMVEHTVRIDATDGAPGAAGTGAFGLVEIGEPVAPGTHIRPAGDDITPGAVLCRAGHEVTPGTIGLLRSAGVADVAAYPRPRVGVVSTGDELVEGTGPLGPGQIYDSNRPTLLTLVAEAGAEPVDLGHADDDQGAITTAIRAGVETCDLVVTTGGVSMGDTDLVKVVLDQLAPEAMRWMQVAIKPAKPLAFGVVEGGAGAGAVPVLGLPGNPVSSMISFELFARPGLRRRAGHPDERLVRPRLAAVAEEALSRRADGKVHFVRVVARVVDGRLQVRSAGGQGSHQLSAMARANALAVLADGPGVEVGESVEVILLHPL